jgi:hypothetical protein
MAFHLDHACIGIDAHRQNRFSPGAMISRLHSPRAGRAGVSLRRRRADA